ncbi:MAG: hypothetical protein ABI895_25325 [Deltaproteobacteria bacterium]
MTFGAEAFSARQRSPLAEGSPLRAPLVARMRPPGAALASKLLLRVWGLLVGGTTLLHAACSESDLTLIAAPREATAGDARAVLEQPSATEAAELELALQENRAEIARAQAESATLEAELTGSELQAELAGAPIPSLDTLRQEREARAVATLSADEQAAILALLGPGRELDSKLEFQGRLVLQGDVLRLADDLLASDAAGARVLVAKANLHLALATRASDRNGNPIPGGPSRPDLIAKVQDGRLLFWRPDLGRRYYIVVPNDLPGPYSQAFVLAAYALEGALRTDCLAHLFTVLSRDEYEALHPLLRARSSVIEVGYSTTACLNLAAGCANSPRLQALAIRRGVVEERMRLGSYIGLESDYDSSRDADQDPDLTPAKARGVVLHELSHSLGFDHPSYSELESDIDTAVARVPQSSQGTVPTFMSPTGKPLFSPTPSAEDRRVLSRVYAGQCSYRADFRSLGEVCSVASEQRCLAHGGSCEVARIAGGTRLERCRWHDLTDRVSCARYSVGTWQTSRHDYSVPPAVFAGEAGACLASELPDCVPDSFLTTDLPSAGRCCSRFGEDEPGLLFQAFSDGDASHYFCSSQKGLGDPGDSWEFVAAVEQADFATLDAATGGSAPGWSVSEGELIQGQKLPSNLALSRERMRSGCVMTQVTTDDTGESGIVFNYRTTGNYYVFDVIPNVRRRIRQVIDGVSADLSVEPWSGPTSWTSIGLSVCYGDGIHTFIDQRSNSRISIDQRVSFVGTGGRVGLWNDLNSAARHAYLRTYPLVEGYALLE